jgi:hypothetical protein
MYIRDLFGTQVRIEREEEAKSQLGPLFRPLPPGGKKDITHSRWV